MEGCSILTVYWSDTRRDALFCKSTGRDGGKDAIGLICVVKYKEDCSQQARTFPLYLFGDIQSHNQDLESHATVHHVRDSPGEFLDDSMYYTVVASTVMIEA